MLPILRNLDSYRTKFDNKLSFDEIIHSNTSNTEQLIAGWICLAIAYHSRGSRSAVPNYLRSGANLFTELSKESDRSFVANPFLLSNEVLYGIKSGFETTTKDKSFPKNHLTDDSYHRSEYLSQVEVSNENDDELWAIILATQTLDDARLQSYSIREMYESFIVRTNDMPMFEKHWNNLALSMHNMALTDEITGKYLELRKSGVKQKFTVGECKNRVFNIVSECDVFEIASNPKQDLSNIKFADFEMLFIDEMGASDSIREKFIPVVTENGEGMKDLDGFLAQLEDEL